jgi:hypothetical protein
MTSFDKSTLINEVSEILNSTKDNPAWFYEAMVLVGDKQFTPYRVINIDIVRDYATDYADKIVIELALPGGTFLHDILPYKEDLRIMLTTVVQSTFHGADVQKPIKTQIFRATSLETSSPVTAGSSTAAKAGKGAIDLMDVRKTKFQLQDIVMEQLRLVTMGSVFRQITPTDFIKGIFSRTGDYVKMDEGNAIKGVTMVDADNHEVQNHIVIPHETKLIDIPDILQNKLCGLYSAGLGFYLQNLMWHIWPLYNFKRFDRSAKTVTIIIVPSDKLQSVERTYRTTANQVIIIVTGGSVHSDDSESKIHNHGNAVRFPDSRKMLEGFGTVSGNKVVADRGANGSQFVGIPRANKLNNVQTGAMTHNLYFETSKLAARAGSQMMVNWQNSDPDLLSPSQPFQVIIERNGLPVIMDACLIGSHTFVSSPETSISSKRHLTNTVLSLFVDRNSEELKAHVESSNVNQYNS